MERGDTELEALLDERFGRSDLTSPSSQEPVSHKPLRVIKGNFSGRIPKPLDKIIGDDGVQRKGEFETEDETLEYKGIAPHQLGTALSHQTRVDKPKS